MRPLSWQVTDRASEVWSTFCFVMAAVFAFLGPVIGGAYLWFFGFMALVMGGQGWLYRGMRDVRGRLDRNGITKTVADKEDWVLPWERVRKVRVRTFLGVPQLIVTADRPFAPWSISSRLYAMAGVPREGAALQLDPASMEQALDILARRRVPIERGPKAGGQ